MEHVVVLMEKALAATRAAGSRVAQVVLVFHFEGFGVWDCDPRLASAFVSVMGQQYPERLHRLILVDAPYLFQPVWTVVRAHTLHRERERERLSSTVWRRGRT